MDDVIGKSYKTCARRLSNFLKQLPGSHKLGHTQVLHALAAVELFPSWQAFQPSMRVSCRLIEPDSIDTLRIGRLVRHLAQRHQIHGIDGQVLALALQTEDIPPKEPSTTATPELEAFKPIFKANTAIIGDVVFRVFTRGVENRAVVRAAVFESPGLTFLSELWMKTVRRNDAGEFFDVAANDHLHRLSAGEWTIRSTLPIETQIVLGRWMWLQMTRPEGKRLLDTFYRFAFLAERNGWANNLAGADRQDQDVSGRIFRYMSRLITSTSTEAEHILAEMGRTKLPTDYNTLRDGSQDDWESTYLTRVMGNVAMQTMGMLLQFPYGEMLSNQSKDLNWTDSVGWTTVPQNPKAYESSVAKRAAPADEEIERGVIRVQSDDGAVLVAKIIMPVLVETDMGVENPEITIWMLEDSAFILGFEASALGLHNGLHSTDPTHEKHERWLRSEGVAAAQGLLPVEIETLKHATLRPIFERMIERLPKGPAPSYKPDGDVHEPPARDPANVVDDEDCPLTLHDIFFGGNNRRTWESTIGVDFVERTRKGLSGPVLPAEWETLRGMREFQFTRTLIGMPQHEFATFAHLSATEDREAVERAMYATPTGKRIRQGAEIEYRALLNFELGGRVLVVPAESIISAAKNIDTTRPASAMLHHQHTIAFVTRSHYLLELFYEFIAPSRSREFDAPLNVFVHRKSRYNHAHLTFWMFQANKKFYGSVCKREMLVPDKWTIEDSIRTEWDRVEGGDSTPLPHNVRGLDSKYYFDGYQLFRTLSGMLALYGSRSVLKEAGLSPAKSIRDEINQTKPGAAEQLKARLDRVSELDVVRLSLPKAGPQ